MREAVPRAAVAGRAMMLSPLREVLAARAKSGAPPAALTDEADAVSRLHWPNRSTSSAELTVISPSTAASRSEEHTSELQSLMRSSYAVFCLKKKKTHNKKKQM